MTATHDGEAAWQRLCDLGERLDPRRAEVSFGAAFRAAAERHPGNVAVIEEDRAWTYQEVLDRAQHLADAVRDRTAEGQPLLVLTPHDARSVVAFIASALSGRPHVFVDPSAPAAFVRRVADQVTAGAVVTATGPAPNLPPSLPVIPVDAATPSPEATRFPEATWSAMPAVDASHAFSVCFTSGSSGVPKAVVHAHRAIVHNGLRFGSAISATPDDRLLLASPFSTVAATTPLATALLHGAAVVPVDMVRIGPRRSLALAAEAGLTIAGLTPGQTRALARYADGRIVGSVRLVTLGGEPADHTDVATLRALFPEALILHRYSTSETHWVAGTAIAPHDPVPSGPLPIGRPMPWVRLRLEEDSQAVDGPGSTGEITVCTDHLALGYLGNDELTRERFLARPDGRWYRTGDRAVIRADGTLAFAGRVETTVKIRGRLVDPVAVEQTLLSMPGIEAACVVPFRAATGDPRLAAFAAGGPWDAAAVREYLASELNDYMRPAFVEVMTELPLMANGKVDRQGLTRHAEQGTRADDDEGSSALERALVQVFQDVLGIGRVSRHDDFFVLGADSLATVELIEVIRARLDLELDPATVVEEPTPQGLARVLAKGRPRPGRLARASTGPAHRRPVAYFPGGGGGSLDRIHALVRAMSPRESWIVVPRGFNGRERPDRTITAQARTAATDLLGLSGGGPPAALIGHSAGGVVALESARWMAADGAPSPVVILLDSAVFGRDDSALNRRTHHLKAATRSRRTGRGAATWISTAVSLGAAWARRGYLASTAGLVPRTGLAQHDAFVAVRSIALDRYRLLPYSGPVVLVRATDRSQDRVADERPDLGWRDVLTGPFTIIDVPGDHLSMLREFLPASASVIADVLSRLDDQGSAQGQAFPEPGS